MTRDGRLEAGDADIACAEVIITANMLAKWAELLEQYYNQAIADRDEYKQVLKQYGKLAAENWKKRTAATVIEQRDKQMFGRIIAEAKRFKEVVERYFPDMLAMGKTYTNTECGKVFEALVDDADDGIRVLLYTALIEPEDNFKIENALKALAKRNNESTNNLINHFRRIDR